MSVNKLTYSCPDHFFVFLLLLSAEDFAQSFQTMLTDFRASYGIGLAVRLGQIARVEINYCWPYRFCKGDRLVKGVQLGLGIDFL